jgi:hypothetical protein
MGEWHSQEASMDGRRFTVDTLVGAAVVLAAGYTMFALPALRGFYRAALSGDAAQLVARDQPLVWAVAVGAMAYGALVALAIRAQEPPVTPLAGLGTGALVGLLLWVTSDFMLFGVSQIGTLGTTVVAPLLEMVPGAMAGWAIAIAAHRSRTTSPLTAWRA